MSARRFEAATTPAALQAVRAAFGDDAFILSNRRLGDRVEIIASATDDGEPEAIKSGSARDVLPRTTRISIESLAGRPPDAAVADSGAASTVPGPHLPMSSPDVMTDAPGHSARPGMPEPAAVEAVVRDAINASLSALFPGMPIPTIDAGTSGTDQATDAAASQPDGAEASELDASKELDAARRSAQDAGERFDALHAKLAAVGDAQTRAITSAVRSVEEAAGSAADARNAALASGATLNEAVDHRMRRIEVALWGSMDEPRSRLLDRLLQLGLGAATAVRLSEQARGGDTDALMRDALARLRDSLPIVRAQAGREHACLGVKLFSGPDSDARLATMLQFAHAAIALGGSRSLALVSADAERTGAFSMLEECARELGCVAVRVRHLDELEAALASLSDRACVLVDAGNAWPACGSVHQRLLVLPATLQRTACEAAVDAARSGSADGCVLCGLNEAGRPGESLEALIERWLPIAFWSDSRDPAVVPRRAEAGLVVAAAIGAARRLGCSKHDRLLGSLLHPGRRELAPGFDAAVAIAGETSQAGLELPLQREPRSDAGGRPCTVAGSGSDC